LEREEHEQTQGKSRRQRGACSHGGYRDGAIAKEAWLVLARARQRLASRAHARTYFSCQIFQTFQIFEGKEDLEERDLLMCTRARDPPGGLPMSAPEWRNTFRVGIYICEMTFRPGHALKAEWLPAMPQKLSDQERDQYRAGRDALLSEAASALGENVMVVEA
jgi:hypothetical protein